MNKTLSALVATAMLAVTVLPGGNADPGKDDLQTATGSCSGQVKGIVSFGVPGCTPAVFDVTRWNADSNRTGARLVTLWGQWVSGVFVTGFEMVVCSDINNDGVCANFGSPPDDFATAYSNDGVGTDGSTSCNKDDKDCGDPYDAELTLCVHADVGTGTFDDLYVFISDWADAGLGGNVGAGVSHGEYKIWLTDGAWVKECPPA